MTIASVASGSSRGRRKAGAEKGGPSPAQEPHPQAGSGRPEAGRTAPGSRKSGRMREHRRAARRTGTSMGPPPKAQGARALCTQATPWIGAATRPAPSASSPAQAATMHSASTRERAARDRPAPSGRRSRKPCKGPPQPADERRERRRRGSREQQRSPRRMPEERERGSWRPARRQHRPVADGVSNAPECPTAPLATVPRRRHAAPNCLAPQGRAARQEGQAQAREREPGITAKARRCDRAEERRQRQKEKREEAVQQPFQASR
jgi:hypothetical protein